MSINSALLAGVTSLVANSSKLAAISDNIANANTDGYKRTDIDFASLVNAGSNSDYSAGGVKTNKADFITQQGTLQASSSPTDLAISGDGFFVTTTKSTGVTANDARLFTRAGSFTVDASGYMKNDAGLYLQGWPADANGVVTPDSSNLSSLTPINTLNIASTAALTTTASINGNLDSDQVPNAAFASYNPAGSPPVDMTEYAADPTTGIKPDFSITMPVSDSKGGHRDLVVDFLKADPSVSPNVPNQWYAEIRADPPSDVASDPNLTPGLVATGIVAFNPDGSLDLANTTLPLSIALGASSATPPAAGSGLPQWANSLGVTAQTISLDLTPLTQFSSPSAVTSVATNGTAFGALSGVSIDDKGFVTAIYDNGTTRRIAQVAIATFPNENGLTPVSGNAFQTSLDSGAFTLKPPLTAGAGSIAPSSLEASTVDLSAEFTGLIVTQRAYSASSKIITTADQMLQELISIKQ